MAENGTTLRQRTRSEIAAMGPVFDTAVLEATRALYAADIDYSLPDGAEVQADLAYGPDPRQRLDLYLSRPDRRGPLLVYIPGGGFVSCDKGGVRNIGCYFARNGITTAIVDYRLAPAAPWPAGAEDVGLALAWVVERVRELGSPGGPVVLFGQSAGAAHAAGYLFGHGGAAPAGSSVTAAVLMNGIYEMTPALQRAPNLVQYFGSDASLYPERSPINAVDNSRTPISLFLGEYDPPMLATPTLELAAKICLRDAKCPPVIWMAGHNHVSPIFAIGTAADDTGPAVLELFAGL